MDLFIGIFLGYLLKDFSFHLKRIANYQTPKQERWDWISLQEDDLP